MRIHRNMTVEDLVEPSNEFRLAVAKCLGYSLDRIKAAIVVTPILNEAGKPSMHIAFEVAIDGQKPGDYEARRIGEMLNASEFLQPN